MKTSPKKIAHIGIAVKSLNQSLPFYTDHLGLELEKVETVESEKVNIAFLKIGETWLELLEPIEDSSPIHKFIDRKGEGIHHIALEVENLASRIKSLMSSGIQMINEEPKIGANESLISFIHPKSTNGVLLELCEHKGED